MKQLSPKSHNHLKQRIVGAVVLIAIIVIFVPMLTNHRTLNTATIANLPAQPDIKTVALKSPADFKPAVINASQVQPVTKAWVVQLGTFSQQNRAQRLVERLQAQGYTSYTYDVVNNKKNYTRVYVGPEIQYAQAAQLQKQLASKYKLNGRIVPFNPLSS